MLASRVTTANLETQIFQSIPFADTSFSCRCLIEYYGVSNKVCSGKSVFVLVTRCSPLVQKKPLPSFSHLLGDVADVCGLYGILLVCRMDGLKTHHALMFFFWDVSTHIGERGNFELECTIQVPPRNHLKMLVGAQKCMYEFKQFRKQNAPSKKKSTWNFRSFS